MIDSNILNSLVAYYSSKIRLHGATPAGVDWNSREGQLLRFDKLLEVVESCGPASIDDYGCGYGALLDYLAAKGVFDYLGLDASEAMITVARAIHPAESLRFIAAATSPRVADYALASGIFNVRLETTNTEWERHILECLDEMHAHSSRGFAFNCLTSYSEFAMRKAYLYYAEPSSYFDVCKKRYARNVALLHDYGMHEFTIIVRK